MKSHIALTALVFLLITLCPHAPHAAPARADDAPEVVDRIVAVVNDDIIVLQELNELMLPFTLQMKTTGYSEEKKRSVMFELRQRLINQLVDQKLVQQAALDLGLTLTEKEIDASIERFKEANKLTDEQLREALSREGISMETYRKQVQDQILGSRMENYQVRSKIVITEEDVAAYYHAHADAYKQEPKYHLRNILIKAPLFGTPEQQQAVLDKRRQVRAALDSGKPFHEVAAQYSEAPFAEEGGTLGIFKLDDLSPNLKAAVTPLSPGQYTPFLETSQGHQILYLEEILQEPAVPLASVYDDIHDKLFQEKYEEKRRTWIDSMRKKAHIRVIQ